MRIVACVILGVLLTITAGLSQTAAVSTKAAPPRKAPEFSLLLPGAAPLPLSQYKGKIVVLTFISTVCSHCQDFTKLISPISRKYAPRGVQFLECAVNGNAGNLLKDFVTQFQPPFPVGWSTPEGMASFLGVPMSSKAMFVPHMVLLDRGGLVRGDWEPGSDFYTDAAVTVPAALDKLLRR